MLDCVGIDEVIFVDDAFSTEIDLVAAISVMDKESAGYVLGTDADLADPDVRRAAAEQTLDRAGDEELKQIRQRALERRPETAADHAAASELASLMPDGRYRGLSLDQWRTAQGEVISEVPQRSPLVLFDQSFENEGESDRYGQRLLREFADATVGQHAWWGLMTHTVPPEGESEARREIAKQEGLPENRFVLISKQRLTDDKAAFSKRLRTMLLAPAFDELFEIVRAAAIDAQTTAVTEARKMTSEELEQIIVRSSLLEGVWEPETLVRVFALLQRPSVEQAVRQNDRVHELIASMRCVSEASRELGDGDADGAQAPVEDESLPGPAWRLQRTEIFMDGDYLNAVHLPVELGDIFRKTPGQRAFVLIAQPCDTVIRRSGTREPELTHCVLAEIKALSGDDLFTQFTLRYFDETDGTSRAVHLNRFSYVRSEIVDLCSFNANGQAMIRPGEEPSTRMEPALIARYKVLGQLAGSALQLWSELSAAVGNEARPQLPRLLGWTDGDLLKPAQRDNFQELTYPLLRVGRLLDPYARALLSRFSQYQARDAYLHDLTRLS